MAQLDFEILCGDRNPTVPDCGTDLVCVDKASGKPVTYSVTRGFEPCKAPVVDTHPPPNQKNGATWNPSHYASVGYVLGDAAHPTDYPHNWFPLPPHSWWDGSTDFASQRLYSLSKTLAQVLDTPKLFAAIQSVTVTVDYDVTVRQRMGQRKLVFFRPDYGSSFDLTSPDSDTTSDIYDRTTTTHHTDVLRQPNSGIPPDTWNSYDLGLFDGTGNIAGYAFNAAEWKNSAYFDPAVANGQTPGAWGSFSQGYGPAGKIVGGSSLEWDVIYQYGLEEQMVTNVRFTIDVSWNQYHCTPQTSGGCDDDGDCNCNHDCPPCQGVNSIHSGKCATFCANGGVSPTSVGAWSITDQNGLVIADYDHPNGWTVDFPSRCSVHICAPCLSPEKLRAGHYDGPYRILWGNGETCVCNGHTYYKVYGCSFSLVADIICEEETPVPGQSVSYDVSDSRRHVRAYTRLKQDGVTYDTLRVGLASNVVPLVWEDVATDITAKRFCIRWDRQSEGSWLYGLAEMVGTEAGKLYLYRSKDEGNTWERLLYVEDGTHPVLLIVRDGRRFCFWYKSGQILVKTFDAAWSVSDPKKVVFPSAADDDFNIDEWAGNNGQWEAPAFYSLASQPGQHPTGFVARDGRRFKYTYGSGSVACVITDSVGHTITSGAVKGLGAVDSAQVAVDETVAEDLTWYVTMLYRSAGKIVCKSSKDGVLFG